MGRGLVRQDTFVHHLNGPNGERYRNFRQGGLNVTLVGDGVVECLGSTIIAASPGSSGAFTVTANSVSPVANVDFGECTAAAGAAITHFGIGTASSGAGVLLYSGTVTPNITMAVGVIPRLKTTSTITED